MLFRSVEMIARHVNGVCVSVPTLAPMADTSWLETFIGWFHDPESLLLAMGPWVLWGTLAIVLVESGVLFPVLPGDSLLFTAGLLHDRLGLHCRSAILTAAFSALFQNLRLFQLLASVFIC